MAEQFLTGDHAEIEETPQMIASNRVEGTPVYNRQKERLGTIHHLMVHKLSGQVEYAVMSFGGFLGMGDDYHPLPWKTLSYDVHQNGYVIDLDRQFLQNAPTYSSGSEPTYNREYTDQIYGYYGSPPYV
jgi:hypothetical protein